MISSLAQPRCFIDIYPYEGGTYTITDDQSLLLRCLVVNDIQQGYGTFSLELAPGGPFGPNTSPQWQDIITPMSLVVIGMQRAGRAQTVLIGVAKQVQEDEVWGFDSSVERRLRVSGLDFGYFFLSANYYTQAYLNLTAYGSLGAQGALAVLDQGLIYAAPDVVGSAWYNKIMAGQTGIMANTSFAYQGGDRPTFTDIVATYFQPYDEVDITIPMADNFMSADGDWMSKFRELFPYPWYEFFITTAPVGTYPGTQAQTPIFLSQQQYGEASPQLVARVNPLPWTKNTGNSTSPNLQMDFSKWDQLPTFQLDGLPNSYLQKSVWFDEESARNFYMLNTTWMSNLFGLQNDMHIPFTFYFGSWLDSASIHRYGFRPQISELRWLIDPSGIAAQNLASSGKGLSDYQDMIADLTLKITSYHEPCPLMMNGQITTNLRPDILPGCRFLFAPRKDRVLWQAYITGVTHDYQFGGLSTTTVQFSRGLPQSVYDDDQLMLDIHTGNAMRQNGDYVSGIVSGLGKPLEPVNNTNMTTVMGDVAKVFAVPQAK